MNNNLWLLLHVHNEKHVIIKFKLNELPTVKMYVEVIPQTKVIRLGFKLPVQVKWNLDGDHNICFWIKTGALAWLCVFLIKKEGFSTESPFYATNEPLASLFWGYDKKRSLIISCYCTVLYVCSFILRILNRTKGSLSFHNEIIVRFLLLDFVFS